MIKNTYTKLFSRIPETLRNELLEAFQKIESNFREGRWEPSELNGGKLCEVVYTILDGFVNGVYAARAFKPRNMVDACRFLEQASSSTPRSIRIQIPRMLMALYEIRNNRGVGHVGGDVDPNQMDALCVLQMSKWVVAELVRVFHEVSVEEASNVVDALSQRELSLIWKINGVMRVLDTSLTSLKKTLILLYSEPSGITEHELIKFIEYSNVTIYRRDVLVKAHKEKLIEYNVASGLAVISPLGSKFVEDKILTRSFLGGINKNGNYNKN